jgi:hypothetical protein
MRLPPSLDCGPWTPSVVPRTTALSPSPDTEAETQRRFAWEAAIIAEARAELNAGPYVNAAAVDTNGADHEVPALPTRRR